MEFQIGHDSHFLFCYHLAKEFFAPSLPDGTLTLRCESDGESVQAHAAFRNESFTLAKSAQTALSREYGLERAENLAVGKAIWRIYTALSEKRPPYGILVGVRPTKVALYYLEHTHSETETEKRLTEDYFVLPEKARLLCGLAKTERDTVEKLSPSDAVLYLSIPFCPSRCRYCSFISQSAPKQLKRLDDYLAVLREELTETGCLFRSAGKTLKAVYLGGGTPGVLSASQLDSLFTALKKSFTVSKDTEVTAELGRPDTITPEKLKVLRDHAVGRVCINPQTLSDEVLSANKRSHTAQCFLDAYAQARAIGGFTINTDLIAGLSGDTPAGFLDSLNRILALEPENITIHSLCKKRASDEEQHKDDPAGAWASAIAQGMRLCINHGLHPYYLYRQKNTIANLENLGYAKPGLECLYNIAMMEDLCDVFSVGAGAITKLITQKNGKRRILRFASYKYPTEYLDRPQKWRDRIHEIDRIFQETQND